MTTRLQTAIGHRQRIRRTIRHLESRLAEGGDMRVLVEDLADVACMSPFHFLRVYAGKTGETPAATLRRWRLAAAREKLASGKAESITALAFDAGYESPSAFSRAFLQAYGQNPSAIAGQRIPQRPSVRLALTRMPEFALVGYAVSNGWRDVLPAYDELLGQVVAKAVSPEKVTVWSVLDPESGLSRAALQGNDETETRLPLDREVRPMRDYLAIEGETAAVWARFRSLSGLGQVDRDGELLMRYGNDPSYKIREEQRITLYVPLRKDAGPLGFAV